MLKNKKRRSKRSSFAAAACGTHFGFIGFVPSVLPRLAEKKINRKLT